MNNTTFKMKHKLFFPIKKMAYSQLEIVYVFSTEKLQQYLKEIHLIMFLYV